MPSITIDIPKIQRTADRIMSKVGDTDVMTLMFACLGVAGAVAKKVGVGEDEFRNFASKAYRWTTLRPDERTVILPE